MGEVLLGDPLSGVSHSDGYVIAIRGDIHTHPPVGRSKFERIRKQVIEYLVHIIRHKVGLHRSVGYVLKIDRFLASIFAVSVDDHPDECRHVAMPPVRFAKCRSHFRDVEQLVNERQQLIALPFDGASLKMCLFRQALVFTDVSAQAEDHRERCTQFVSDVRKEAGAQFFHLPHHSRAQPLEVYKIYQEQHDNEQHDGYNHPHEDGDPQAFPVFLTLLTDLFRFVKSVVLFDHPLRFVPVHRVVQFGITFQLRQCAGIVHVAHHLISRVSSVFLHITGMYLHGVGNGLPVCFEGLLAVTERFVHSAEL